MSISSTNTLVHITHTNKPLHTPRKHTPKHAHTHTHTSIVINDTHLVDEGADELGFEDVTERNPVEEPHQSVQRGAHQ